MSRTEHAALRFYYSGIERTGLGVLSLIAVHIRQATENVQRNGMLIVDRTAGGLEGF
jgi:hypothetical protein